MNSEDLVTRFLMSLQVREARTQVEPDLLASHQREATDRILSSLEIYPGVLLADAAGLGKSYIAAAVAQRFEARGAVVELIVPHALIPQWALLLEQFRLSASLESQEALSGRGCMPSVEGMRLLIVDEAHRFRNSKRKRYRSLALRAVGAKVLLITATPICNSIGDLHALVALFAADDLLRSYGVGSLQESFAQGNRESIARIRDELIVRRGREVLSGALRLARLERSVVHFSLSDPHAAIAEAIATLNAPLLADASAVALVRAFLWRRLESSGSAFIESVRRQGRFYRRARESWLKGVLLSRGDYRAMFGIEDDAIEFQDVLFRDLWSAPSQADPELGDRIDREIRMLERLAVAASDIDEPKRARLMETLAALKEPEVLIYTSAVATARSLYALLTPLHRCGIVSSRLCSAAGLPGRVTSEDVFHAFRSGAITCLIATDMAAEGLNLQQAGTVIHYDLAWNMVRLEQREARACRIGQKRSSVSSIYFVNESQGRASSFLPIVLRKARMSRRFLPDPAGKDADGNALSMTSTNESPYLSVDHSTSYSVLLLHEVFASGERKRFREVTLAGELSTEIAPAAAARHLRRARNFRDADGLPEPLIEAVRAADELTRMRSVMPSLQSQTASRERLAALLRSSGSFDPDFEALLTGRFRVGLEILIEEMSGEFFDEDRRGYLSRLLSWDLREMTNPSTLRIEIVGGVFTNDWSAAAGSAAAGANSYNLHAR
ncbi:MAG TPA: DEAD/DEAH box helicase [Thermoanaerobaculia bacterium]|nr:DEAD/DEAH box helicase [Thermoanaerobaculia bacterium]